MRPGAGDVEFNGVGSRINIGLSHRITQAARAGIGGGGDGEHGQQSSVFQRLSSPGAATRTAAVVYPQHVGVQELLVKQS